MTKTPTDSSDTAPGYGATIAALSLGQLVAWAALFYTFSSFALPMRSEFGWSEPQAMSAFTLGLAIYGASAYAVGAAIDRGRGRLVLSAGPVIGGLGLWLWSAADGLAMLYGAWSLLGIAMAMLLYEPAFMVLTKRYPERFRRAITTLTLSGGFASTLSFSASAWLIASIGWRDALRVIGVALIAIAPLHAWALRGPMAVAERSPHAALPSDDDAPTLHRAVRGPAFWLLALAFAFNAFAASALWAHVMSALAAKGLGRTESLAIAVWFGPAQVAGRLAYLAGGRWLAPRALAMAVLGCLPLSLAIFAVGRETAVLLAFAVLFGLANGLVAIVRGGLLPDYFGRAHLGRISGAMTGIALFARAGAPLAAATLLVAFDGSYRAMLLALAGIGALAVLAYALAGRPPAARR
ncbi:MAG: MFS transporter [Proteobacteria bacterium]|nr:MFS transporter [Pseudomonadota bacterium]